jgi:protein-S-isoprenylcysteine O-methyltransferase Ste14
MNDLKRRVLISLARFQIALALLLFLPAWSLTWWQGWLYWFLFGAACLVLTLYFLRHDPALIARRLGAGPAAEREPRQKLIQGIASLLVCTLFILSGFDHAFGWSSVSPATGLIADAVVMLGFYVMFLAFRENSFAASTIQVDSGQRVIDTGLYGVVRHPMYVGALIMFIATPIALGSWWGLVPVALLAAAIGWRLTDEENFLVRHLAGYADYRRKVRARLIPGVW